MTGAWCNHVTPLTPPVRGAGLSSAETSDVAMLATLRKWLVMRLILALSVKHCELDDSIEQGRYLRYETAFTPP
jgi:hypothetical protein